MNRGFSLVELLVVIAIIMMLVAFLMPVIGGMRNAAKLSWCQSNIRQLHQGFMAYVADYAGWLPFTRSYDAEWPHRRDWLGYWAPPEHDANAPHEGSVWPYILEKRVYFCPADSKTRTRVRGDGLGGGYWYRNTLTTHSYSLRTYALDDPAMDWGWATMLSRYPTRNYPFIIGESGITIEDGASGSSSNVFASRHRLSVSDAKSRYDRAGGNIGFLDGHVEFYHSEQITSSGDPVFRGILGW